jgi:hypothetical protein
MALLQTLRGALRQAPTIEAKYMLHAKSFASAADQMKLIKELRERSGAPMMEVKAALQQSDWNLGEHSLPLSAAAPRPHEPSPATVHSTACTPSYDFLGTDDASDALRKKGLAAAGKKASRHAAEGLVGVVVEGASAAIVEVRRLRGLLMHPSFTVTYFFPYCNRQ